MTWKHVADSIVVQLAYFSLSLERLRRNGLRLNPRPPKHKAWVSKARPAMLCFAAHSHVRILRIYYENYTTV
jgi:hypothetical protein